MPIRDILALLLVVAIWGFNFVVMKHSVEILPPLLAAALRFTFTAFPLMLFVKPPSGRWLVVAAYGTFFGTGLYIFLNLALYFGMPAGLTSIVLHVQAFFTLAFAFVFLGERPRVLQILGGAISFGGIVVLGLQRSQGAELMAFLLTIGAAVCFGFSNIVGKRAGDLRPLQLAVWSAIFAAVPLFVLSVIFEGTEALGALLMRPDPEVIGVIAFLAYPATLLPVVLWNAVLRKHPASVVAPFALLVPVTGMCSGAIILGERISAPEIIGGALVVGGLAVSLFRTRRGRALPITST